MDKKGWKTFAVVLMAVLVIENIFIALVFYLGVREINNEAECSVNVCSDAESYHYENGYCTCYARDYTGQLQILRQRYLE